MSSGYLPRLLGPSVADDLEIFPIVIITGARQTGKSTLTQESELLAERPYVTLDELAARDQAKSAP